ncbi:hypothetical protein CBOM_03495 [Ceraceosorus bombacis]|uniref:Uncharacterized protein n=1 Tax=Ceraceosorus bombacis TaxID=401625 RepID=A0A0P1BM79_9BASI|nr:hypothetical protein CBOM_03495 [Ceraceosorus bombacis]
MHSFKVIALLLPCALLALASFASATSTVQQSAVEPRQAGGIGRAVVQIGKVLARIVEEVMKDVEADKVKRADQARETVDRMAREYPDTNFLASHVEMDNKFGGVEKQDWAHDHFEVDIKVGGTIGFELWGFQDAVIKRKGDGGALNWAWTGVLEKDPEENGSLLTFARRKH